VASRQTLCEPEIAQRLVAVKAAKNASTGAGAAAGWSVDDEIAWQLSQLTAAQHLALRRLPPLGTDSSGPLGPGLLSPGILGVLIRELQK
jgi:hypothetical protein